MSDAATNVPRIAMIVTRDVAADSGRARTIREIEHALKRNYWVTTFRLRSSLETHSASDVAAAAWEWCRSIFTARPLPLQCALYASPAEHRRLAREIAAGGFEAVYLDMVRCQLLLRHLRLALPEIRIVTDFDDLVSRRMGELVKLNRPLLTGYAGAFIPAWLRRLIEGPLSRLVTRYDAATMASAEHEMLENSDAIVLVSSSERTHLLHMARESQAPIYSAAPPCEIKAQAAAPTADRWRFVFVGSDRLLQNRLAIDFLLALWWRLRPTAELHIYGGQQRERQKVCGVLWHGFVPNIAEAYRPGSISLVPALLPGGIKTKVIEGWSYGCPVLGNACAFEGLAIGDYALSVPEDRWEAYILDPGEYAQVWAAAAKSGNDFVRDALSRDRYAGIWQQIVSPKVQRADAPAQAALHPVPAV